MSGADPAGTAAVTLPHEAEQQRRQRQHQQHLDGLDREIDDQGPYREHQQKADQAANTKLR